MNPKRMEGFVETPEGNHRVEMVELPDPKDPTAPPKKNSKDDLICQDAGRADIIAPSETIALAGCLSGRYGDVHRVIQQPVKQHDCETRAWALKVLYGAFEAEDGLKLRKAAAMESIAARKEVLAQRGYPGPKNPRPIVDDAFEQLTAAIADAIEPLIRELELTRAERDKERLAREKQAQDFRDFSKWKAALIELLPMILEHQQGFIDDIDFFEDLEKHLRAVQLHTQRTLLERLFKESNLPTIPQKPIRSDRNNIPVRWKKSKQVIDQLQQLLKALPSTDDRQGQPLPTNPDDVRTNIYNFPGPTAQQTLSDPASTSTAASIADGRAEKPSPGQLRQPLTTNPDTVRTMVASTATTDKPSPSIRAPESRDKQGAELTTDQQRSKG